MPLFTRAKDTIRSFPKKRLAFLLAAAATAFSAGSGLAQDNRAARDIFGALDRPAPMRTASIGSYAKGCLAGAAELPSDGDHWQAMRLSRNRHWGHPDMIALIERLASDAARLDGWPGLLVGDVSQPRGGPMKSGHASHQIGLDVDIWLKPMPDRRLTRNERETIGAPSMLVSGTLRLDKSKWTAAHEKMIMRAAGYADVERIFVHPAIKKKLCETWRGDRSELGKVRPYWGHDDHIHVRIACRRDSPDCQPQAAVPAGDGCDKSLAWWFTDEPWKPAKPGGKKKQPARLSDLPAACAAVAGVATGEAAAAAIPVPSPAPR